MDNTVKLAFFTNFDNHHQIPLADELYRIYGNRYVFVTREEIPKEFRKRGYHNYERPYILRMETSKENVKRALQILSDAEFVLFGDAPLEWIRPRIRAGKPVLFYNERWFKTGWRRYMRRSFWKNLLLSHFPSRWRPTYMLAASAYMRHDCSKIFAYPNKVYRWGYFPAVERLDLEQVIQDKALYPLKLVWCGTMTPLKHPELPLLLMSKLGVDDVNAHLCMIGQGPLLEGMKRLAFKLNVESRVEFIQDIPNEEVKSIFRQSHIFLFTSDWMEGWGCVLNEAMASGCAVVASHEIGSVPFLIRHKVNGLIFKSRHLQSLYEQVNYLVKHRDKLDCMARQAYRTMQEEWSPHAAAHSLVRLICHLEDPRQPLPLDGPCSEAPSFTPSSFYRSLI